MQITGEQLFFLIQVLKDSLDIQMGYDYNYKHKLHQRQIFHDKFIETLLSKQKIHICEIDLMELQSIKKVEN